MVGVGVGLVVGGEPGQTAKLIREKGVDAGAVLLPPPQLKSRAAPRNTPTGTSTTHLRNQSIAPCTMPTRVRGVKHCSDFVCASLLMPGNRRRIEKTAGV